MQCFHSGLKSRFSRISVARLSASLALGLTAAGVPLDLTRFQVGSFTFFEGPRIVADLGGRRQPSASPSQLRADINATPSCESLFISVNSLIATQKNPQPLNYKN
jgi:hypothetical protein